MSSRALKKNQPKSFKFTEENLKKAKSVISKYPKGRQQSAVLPLLDMAQRQSGGWLPIPAMEMVSDMLDMAYIRVYEVATFYSMFNLSPVGQNFIQVCRTTPCWLRGSDNITKACKNKLGVDKGEITEDKKFSFTEVECLGACVNAPMVQINDDYYEDLTPQKMEGIIDDLKKGLKPKVGTQIKRTNSAPVGSLTSLKKYDKSGK